MKIKTALKKWWRQLICKHDYKSEVYVYGIRHVCKKCGKIHTVQYKKITY